VGTGQGLFPILAQQSGWEAWALDISAYACAYLTKRGIRAQGGYLEEVTLPDDYFDVVTLWHCLEHTFDPLTTLQAARRVLKPEGILVIEVPRITRAELCARKVLRKPLFAFDLCEWHFYHFTPKSLTRLVTQAGFSVSRVGHQPVPRKTRRGQLIEFLRDLVSWTRLINLHSTIFLVARKSRP